MSETSILERIGDVINRQEIVAQDGGEFTVGLNRWVVIGKDPGQNRPALQAVREITRELNLGLVKFKFMSNNPNFPRAAIALNLGLDGQLQLIHLSETNGLRILRGRVMAFPDLSEDYLPISPGQVKANLVPRESDRGFPIHKIGAGDVIEIVIDGTFIRLTRTDFLSVTKGPKNSQKATYKVNLVYPDDNL